MPQTSVQHIKRNSRLSGQDLTRLIRKKSFGANVIYNFGDKTEQIPIGWYAHFTNKPPKFIGHNWLAARDYINKLPTDNILKRFVPSFLITSFTLKGINT